jgi:protein-L-isoaspartate(D-aspartate) O-methyltransferase
MLRRFYLYTDDLVGIPENQQWATVVACAPHSSGIAWGRRTRGAYRNRHRLLHRYPDIVGPSGRVTGIEYEPELAARARTNFSTCPNVDIVEGDGALVSFETADVIYVNAGCTRPAESWLDRLAEGGRLILPMTSDESSAAKDQGFAAKSLERIERAGAVFRIERRGKEYLVCWISGVAIFPCAGNRDVVSERALAESFANGGWQKVTRLYIAASA